ncbi:MAG: prolyl oligopeptidase family serine peptidase [Fibrobacteres bacterium]|nr:prolyl oligopeptidase family serine peptidase [Fibrobacterota bacterium]
MQNSNRISAIAILAFTIFSSPLIAQTPSNVMQLRKQTGSGMTLYYHLYKPEGYSSNVKYPLIMAFHGVGEDGDSSNTLYINNNGLVSAWVATAFQKKYPCFVVAPHNPSGSWIDTDWTVSNTNVKYRQGPISSRLAVSMKILDSLIREFPIDTNRLYVTGLSIGGWATWDLVTRYPDKFAAALPQSGGVDTSKAGLLVRTPIWSYNGKQDAVVAPLSVNLFMDNLDKLDGDKGVVYTQCQGNNCPAKMSANKIDSLINAGMTHFYSLDPAHGHEGWDLYYGDTLIQKWIMKQQRDTPAAGLKQRTRNSASHGPQSGYGLIPLGSRNTESESGSGPELFEANGKRVMIQASPENPPGQAE